MNWQILILNPACPDVLFFKIRSDFCFFTPPLPTPQLETGRKLNVHKNHQVKWRDLTWPRKGPEFNLYHQREILWYLTGWPLILEKLEILENTWIKNCYLIILESFNFKLFSCISVIETGRKLNEQKKFKRDLGRHLAKWRWKKSFQQIKHDAIKWKSMQLPTMCVFCLNLHNLICYSKRFWRNNFKYPSRHTTPFQRLYDAYTTSLTSYRRRVDVETTSCVYWYITLHNWGVFMNPSNINDGASFFNKKLHRRYLTVSWVLCFFFCFDLGFFLGLLSNTLWSNYKFIIFITNLLHSKQIYY